MFTDLHHDVENGFRPMPPIWTITGWRYRRWVKQNSLGHRRSFADASFSGIDRMGFHGAFSGRASVISAPQEWQTTTNLSCGFNPNVAGAPAPVIGTPLGQHVVTGAEVGCDPLAWFREGIIANPSCFVLSLPGLGKSTLIRKMLMGDVAQGHVPIIAGDIKAEYVGFVEQVGGQVIRVGHGEGTLNPLDVGALGRTIPWLKEIGREDLALRAAEQVHGRQVTMVSTLVGLGRNSPILDWETMIVAIALREIAHERSWENPPTLQDLIERITCGSPELFDRARVTTQNEWNQRVDNLLLSLNSLLDGATGKIFAGQTTTPIDVNATAVVVDVSAIDRGDRAMKAAVMMACWSACFGAIEASHLLADAGLAKQKYFSATLDELWQVLAAAPGMVQQVDALTRLNRTDATVLNMITHTFKDLEALPLEQDRKTAMGFIERAGMVITGGLPNSELDILASRLEFSPAEAELVVSWSRGAVPKRSRTIGARAIPAGRGRFMIKPSKDGAPGIPIRTILTQTEIEFRLHDTNVRFDEFFKAGEAR